MEKEIESKFKQLYLKWAKKCIPSFEIEDVDKLSTAYLDFFKYLLTLKKEKALEIFERLRNKSSFEFLPKTELLSEILISKDDNESSVNESLVFYNAFLIKEKLDGFKNYNFSNTYDPSIGHIIPYSKLMKEDLGLLNQWNLINIKISSAARIEITETGIEYVKSEITYWLNREKYEQVIIKENDYTFSIYEEKYFDHIMASYY